MSALASSRARGFTAAGAALVLLAAIAAACAGRASGPAIGVSNGGRDEPRGAGGDGGGEGGALSTVIPPDFRESMSKVNRARFVSNGHAAGRFEADVYANGAGK